MPSGDKSSTIELRFSNYNYSFNNFYESYKRVCIEISETKNIRKVRQNIYTFISEYSYGVPNPDDRTRYAEMLIKLKDELDNDREINVLIDKESLTQTEEIEYLKH